jgi:hypothetical protein
VDFSTQCVLLAFRQQARPTQSLGVDSGGSPMYSMVQQLQIVYSDRRGDLRVKWQSSTGEIR